MVPVRESGVLGTPASVRESSGPRRSHRSQQWSPSLMSPAASSAVRTGFSREDAWRLFAFKNGRRFSRKCARAFDTILA